MIFYEILTQTKSNSSKGKIMQNIDLRIITDDYYVVKAKHTNRALHRHEGYEAFYVISGSCDHVLILGNTEQTQKLSCDNFMILDNSASHQFKNGSPDFCVINFLFKPCFVFDDENFANTFYENESNIMLNILQRGSGNILSLFEKAYNAFNKNSTISRTLAKCYAKELLLSCTQSLNNTETTKGIVADILAYVKDHFSLPITLSKICEQLHYSLPYVSRKFKQVYGLSFEKHLQNLRIQHACMLLIKTDMSISEVALAVSYTDIDTFRKIFFKRLGKTPSLFRKEHL